VEEVWLTHHVSYKDLDLKDPAGAAELRKRVQDTAGMACNELDKLYIGDISDTPTSTCVANAVDQAKPQVDAAIAKAMG
jgi:UrcA family protein